MDVSTLLIHGDEGARPDGAVTPPIAQGTNFAAASGDELRVMASRPLHPDFYNRHGNPNHAQVAAGAQARRLSPPALARAAARREPRRRARTARPSAAPPPGARVPADQPEGVAVRASGDERVRPDELAVVPGQRARRVDDDCRGAPVDRDLGGGRHCPPPAREPPAGRASERSARCWLSCLPGASPSSGSEPHPHHDDKERPCRRSTSPPRPSRSPSSGSG